MRLRHDSKGFQLTLDSGWLHDNPLTATALRQESEFWHSVNLPLEVVDETAGR